MANVMVRALMVTFKKYGNRRLYDTSESRYVTLDEVAETVRAGADIRVVDAKTGQDLTQGTLAQIILESRGAAALLPVPLLVQLVRMGDDALGEFFGRYVSAALELYFQARAGAQAVSPYNPFATLPFTAGNAIARLFAPAQPAAQAPADDVSSLRREIDEMKRAMNKPAKKKARARR